MENWRVRQDVLLSQRDSLEATVLRLTMELGRMRVRKTSTPRKEDSGGSRGPQESHQPGSTIGPAAAKEEQEAPEETRSVCPEAACSKKKRKSEEVTCRLPASCPHKENANPQLLSSRQPPTPMKLASFKDASHSSGRQVRKFFLAAQ